MTEARDGLDILLTEIGTTLWSVIHFGIASFAQGSSSYNLLGGELINPFPYNFTCNAAFNITESDRMSQCFWTGDNNITFPCTQWTYDTSIFHSTVAMEWNLVCDQAYLYPLYQTMFSKGSIIGGIAGGFSANKLGRKSTIQIASFMALMISFFLAEIRHFYFLLILRFSLGMFVSMMTFPGIILGMEMCIPRLRSVVGIMIGISYALSIICFALMGYGIREWRFLQLTSCSLLIPLVFTTFLIDESPRWLLVNGRVDEAIKVLQRACSHNKHKCNSIDIEKRVTEIYQEIIEKNLKTEETRWTTLLMSLFKHAGMRKITILLFLYWYLQCTVYLGIPLNADGFSSPYLYIGLIGLMELIAFLITAPISLKFGRKVLCMTGMTLGATSIFINVILKSSGALTSALELCVMLIAYFSICSAFQISYTYTSELFPTTVRPYGSSLVHLGSALSYSLSPILIDYLTVDLPLVKPIILGCSGVAAGILVCFLPETHNMPLMETLDHLTVRLNPKITDSSTNDDNPSSTCKGSLFLRKHAVPFMNNNPALSSTKNIVPSINQATLSLVDIR